MNQLKEYGLTLLLAGSLLFAMPGLAQEEDAESDTSSGDTASEDGTSTDGDDIIRLQSIFVGDKEQPAISYFIPWQGVGTPDDLHWNVEEKHDQALGTVDREVMIRSMELYNGMNLEQIQ